MSDEATVIEVAPGCYVEAVTGGWELSYTSNAGQTTHTVRRPTLEALHDHLAHMNIHIPDLVKVEKTEKKAAKAEKKADKKAAKAEKKAEPEATVAVEFVEMAGNKAEFSFTNDSDEDVVVERLQGDKTGKTTVKAGETIKRSWRADPGDVVEFTFDGETIYVSEIE